MYKDHYRSHTGHAGFNLLFSVLQRFSAENGKASISAWLLCLYPRPWRERYGDEMAAVLVAHPTTLATCINLLLCALDAHLHPDLLPESMSHTLNRQRNAAITIFCAYCAFIVAVLGFQKMTEDAVSAGAGRPFTAIGFAYSLVGVGVVIGLLAVLVGGLPIVFSMLRYAVAARRRDTPLLLAVPPIALAIFLGYTLFLAQHVQTQHMSQQGLFALLSTMRVILWAAWIVLFLLAALASTAAVAAAVARSQLSVRAVRFARLPALIVTLTMVLMLAATITWGLTLRAHMPHAFSSDGGVLVSYKVFTWLRVVLLMAISTAIAALALARGEAARRAATTAG